MKNSQKGFVVPLIIAIVAILIVVGGYYYFKNDTIGISNLQIKPELPIQQAQQNNQPVTQNNSDETSGWKTYTNSQYGFSFKYPSNFTKEEINGKNTNEPSKILELSLNPDRPASSISINYINNPILDVSSPGEEDKIYFDQKTNQWLEKITLDGNGKSFINKLTPTNTIGNLPSFLHKIMDNYTKIVALSQNKFILIKGLVDPEIVDKIVSTVIKTY